MTTTIVRPAHVLHLPVAPSVEPAPVPPVCDYCLNVFVPTRDPEDGTPWDRDDEGQHCCDDCHCATCLVGHGPDQTCPNSLEPADHDGRIADEFAVYGDPDARYDAQVDAEVIGNSE